MTREEALNKTIGILTYHQVNFCKSKEAVANMNEIIEALDKIDQEQCGDCISREETLKALMDEWTEYDSELIGWLFEKIDKLPPVTPQPCEDCVSRQAALEAFGLSEKSRKYDGDHSGYDTLMKYEIQDILEDLPSVTAQPKIGKWIMSDDGLYRPICNNCGAHPWKGYIPTVEEATEAFKYCPHCGCAMQEVEG